MSAAPTPGQVRALVAELRRKRPHDRAVAIRSAGRWTGDPTLTWNGETWLIRQCDSPLAVDSRGGRVAVEVGPGLELALTGPAALVFEGAWAGGEKKAVPVTRNRKGVSATETH